MAEAQVIETDVLVVGAGPAGLLLARELRIAGAETKVIDRLVERSAICRGFTLNARSLDILARRGMLEPFLAEGRKVPHAAYSGLPITPMLEGAATDHPYTLGIGQDRVERILEGQARDVGVDVHWGNELLSFAQDDAGVTATVVCDGRMQRVRAQYLAGCDGSRSVVRKHAGIDFPGTVATRFTLLGDVEPMEPSGLTMGIHKGPGGDVYVIPRPGYVRILLRDPKPPADRDRRVALEEFVEAVDAALGRRIELCNVRWLTRFGDAARLASRYVAGRVVLAGDAAHIHPPAGAIGVNVALDDAFNLGWKLAAMVRGGAPAGLLESYHEERHAAGERVLESTRAQVLLAGEGEELRPVREFLTRFFGRPDVNVALAETVTYLDTCYGANSGEGGRMVRDFGLCVAGEEMRLVTLLCDERGVLIDGTESGEFVRSFADRVANVRMVHAPGSPRAMLVRPDGHAAWIADGGSDELEKLRAAVARWFDPGPC